VASGQLFPSITSATSLCNEDNCLRAFQNNPIQAPVICSDGLASPPVSTYPAFASPCSSSAARISSACYCVAITQPTTTSSSPSTKPPTTCPTTCPTIPSSTVTITQVTTVSVLPPSSSLGSAATSTTCSCASLVLNPSFEGPAPAPWRIIQDDPNGHWSLAPSQDIPGGAYRGYVSTSFFHISFEARVSNLSKHH